MVKWFNLGDNLQVDHIIRMSQSIVHTLDSITPVQGKRIAKHYQSSAIN